MRNLVDRSRPSTSVLRHPRRRAALAAVALGAVALTGCGSSAPKEGASKDQDASFCSAVGEYVDASKIGDRTAMAAALDGALDDLSGDARRDVGAYVEALRSSPANEAPDGDGVEADSTEEAFRSYVADTCGDDVKLPEESDATTTSSPPASSGGGGTTDDTGVDGSGTGTDSGGGAATGGGM